MHLKTAVKGGPVRFDHPAGPLRVSMPPHTWEGRTLRVAGAGFPDPKPGRPGDCFLTVRIRPGENDDEKNVYSRYIETVRGPGQAPDESLSADLVRMFGP